MTTKIVLGTCAGLAFFSACLAVWDQAQSVIAAGLGF